MWLYIYICVHIYHVYEEDSLPHPRYHGQEPVPQVSSPKPGERKAGAVQGNGGAGGGGWGGVVGRQGERQVEGGFVSTPTGE